MGKAERLFCLMEFVKRCGPIGLEQPAAEFCVSVRTIYRDLQALTALNVPIQQNLG